LYTFITFEVLDPRLKLGYYEDHDWEINWIEAARTTFQSVYEDDYEQDNNTIFETTEEAEDNIHAHIYGRKSQLSSAKAINKDSFHAHIYGKKSQKKQPLKVVGEVQEYLNEKRERFQKGEDALSWWKVSILSLCILDYCNISH
jgi:uncharacterized protein (DUF111 family)